MVLLGKDTGLLIEFSMQAIAHTPLIMGKGGRRPASEEQHRTPATSDSDTHREHTKTAEYDLRAWGSAPKQEAQQL